MKTTNAEIESWRKDSVRYKWLIENGNRNGGLFLGYGDVGPWGECGHSMHVCKEYADQSIDEAIAADRAVPQPPAEQGAWLSDYPPLDADVEDESGLLTYFSRDAVIEAIEADREARGGAT